MKFLLNMNVPRELGERLGAAGHAYRHAGDIGLAQASDRPSLRRRQRGARSSSRMTWIMATCWRFPALPDRQS